MNKIYSESFFLSAGECNAEQEMSVPLLVSKLIDIATVHANSLHIGNPDMPEVKGGWVLSRLTVEMTKYPKANDHYRISTWIESFNRHFSDRCFAIETPEGEVLGYARSVWMIMDAEAHTNVSLDRFDFVKEFISDKECPIPRQAKHLQIVPSEDFNGARGTVASTHADASYRFLYCDLDYYRHVNTVRYIRILLNQFSLEDYDTHYVSRLEVSFLREARYDMAVAIRRTDNPETGMSSFFMVDKADNQPILYSRLRISPRY